MRLSTRRAAARARALAVVFVATCVAPASAAAHDGRLDLGFSADGKVIDEVATGRNVVTAIAHQPDGKIVAVGYADVDATAETNFAIAVARYNADGSRDFNFRGPDGSATGAFTIDIGAGQDAAHGVAVAPNGDIVIAGEAGAAVNTSDPNAFGVRDPAPSGFSDTVAIRLTTEGFLRPTFDGPSGSGDGIVKINAAGVASTADGARDLQLSADGKLVLAGYAGSGSSADFLITRLNDSGTLDSGFAGDGTATFDRGSDDIANAVAIQPDGKLVFAGGTAAGASGRDFAVGRLTATGSLDSAFDGPPRHPPLPGDGLFSVPVEEAADDQATDLTLQPDGRIVLAGFADGTAGGVDFDFALVRLTAAGGDLDGGFDGDGKAVTPIAGNRDQAFGVARQADGKIVAVGRAGSAGVTGGPAFGFARYRADGSLDGAFDGDSGAGDGRFTLRMGGSLQAARDVSVDAQGRIVAGGGVSDSSSFLLARLLADGPPETVVTSEPPASSGDDTPTFSFASTDPDATFECRLDGGAFAACGTPHTLGPLAQGRHTLEVRARDSAGNVDPTPESRSFDVEPPAPGSDGNPPADEPAPVPPPDGPGGDADEPQTVISKGPGRKLVTERPRATVRFRFTADEAGSAFDCSLDRAPFKPCASPLKVKLKPGRHVFRVRATDAFGNVDESPATRRFRVVRSD